MRRCVLLLAAVLTLGSCVGIDSRMSIRADGSGTVALTYKVSQLVADLGRPSSDPPMAPLPIYREDFERGLQGVSGVALKSFQRIVSQKDITIRAEVSFDKVESLGKIAAFRDAAPILTSSGGRHTLTQTLVRAAPAELSEDSLQMIDTLFDGYTVSLGIQTPSPIQSSSAGVLSADKKELTFSAPVRDLVASKTDVVITLSW